MTQAQTHKAVAYAVEQTISGVRAHKAVAYVVEQQAQPLNTHKAVAYAVELSDLTGNATQPIAGDRPIYRVGLIPFAEFSPGDRLVVNVPFAGNYTLLRLLPGGAFDAAEVALSAGEYTLTADFNQAMLIRAVGMSTTAIESVRRTMRIRAGLS